MRNVDFGFPHVSSARFVDAFLEEREPCPFSAPPAAPAGAKVIDLASKRDERPELRLAA